MSNYVEDVKVDKAMEGALRGLADGWTRIRRISMPRVRAVAGNEALPDGEWVSS